MSRATGTRIAAGMLALAAGACGADAEQNTEPGGAQQSEPERTTPASYAGLPAGWQKLPAPPISGRLRALVAAVGDEIIVAGGNDWVCSPGANCVRPTTPPFADGAAYDLKTGQWRSIAVAPAPFIAEATVVVGNDVYSLVQLEGLSAGLGLLRYRTEAGEWDTLPAPEGLDGVGLMAVTGGVVVYNQSEEVLVRADHRFFAAENRWVRLPEDPFPFLGGRIVIEYGQRLMLFGTPIEDGALSRNTVVAAYDAPSEAWEELAPSGTLGSQVWRAGSLFYLNPHFQTAEGGIYNPSANRWSPLPDRPYHDMAGVIGHEEASYAYPAGWVLDTRDGSWLEIEPRPASSDLYDEVIAPALNQGLVVVGGQGLMNGTLQAINDTWLWTPPPVSGSPP